MESERDAGEAIKRSPEIFMKFLAWLFAFTLLPGVATASTITIPAPGANREAATVILPDSLADRPAWPVVLLLHGFSGSGNSVNNHFGLGQEVNRRGFILVLPNGRKSQLGPRYWNATDACCDFDRSKSDDVSYLTGLIKEIEARVPVDSKRIYVAGHSNGAFMAHRLACDTSGLFAGIASFAGVTFKNLADCKSQDKISMLQIHAVDDGTIKFSGDERGFPSMAPYPGSELTVSRWVERNGCIGGPETRGSLDLIRTIPDRDAGVQVWNSCMGNTQVAFWKIQAHRGQGHNAHTPSLTDEFRGALLDFLLEKKRD